VLSSNEVGTGTAQCHTTTSRREGMLSNLLLNRARVLPSVILLLPEERVCSAIF
jgi:hypothetical protein